MNIETSTPAKIILFGEHAVVHGQPAIAAPVTSLRARVVVSDGHRGDGLVIDSPNTRQLLHVSMEEAEPKSSLVLASQLALRSVGITQPPDLLMSIHSEIPLGRGLGSGAAVSAALVKALLQAIGKPPSLEELNALIYQVEKQHHGTPSGIDNTVVVYEKPVYFVREHPLETINIAKPFTLLVGDTGYGTPTHITVGDVRRLYERNPNKIGQIFARIGDITRQARQAIETGTVNDLGALMNENHDLLQRLTVSSIELDFLCEAALAAGAIGAKLSGGGRGGNMIALVNNSLAEHVSKAMYSAGAQRVVKTRVRTIKE